MGNAASRVCGSSSPTVSLSDICQRMQCLVASCSSEVHVELKDVTDNHEEENEEKKKETRTLNQTNQLLQKLYYEVDRPSALGGIDKLYRAALWCETHASNQLAPAPTWL